MSGLLAGQEGVEGGEDGAHALGDAVHVAAGKRLEAGIGARRPQQVAGGERVVLDRLQDVVREPGAGVFRQRASLPEEGGNLGHVLALALGCSVVAYFLYNWELEEVPASVAVSIMNLVPAFGLFFS